MRTSSSSCSVGSPGYGQNENAMSMAVRDSDFCRLSLTPRDYIRVGILGCDRAGGRASIVRGEYQALLFDNICQIFAVAIENWRRGTSIHGRVAAAAKHADSRVQFGPRRSGSIPARVDACVHI